MPCPVCSKYEVLNLKVIHRRRCTGFEQARELPLHIDDVIAGRYQVRCGKGWGRGWGRDGAGGGDGCVCVCEGGGGGGYMSAASATPGPCIHGFCEFQIVDLLGQAAFSRAVQALDLKTGALVCLKIIKVSARAWNGWPWASCVVGCSRNRLHASAVQNNKDYFDQGLDEVKLLQFVNAADPQDEAGLLRLFDFFYYKVGQWGRCCVHDPALSAPRCRRATS